MLQHSLNLLLGVFPLNWLSSHSTSEKFDIILHEHSFHTTIGGNHKPLLRTHPLHLRSSMSRIQMPIMYVENPLTEHHDLISQLPLRLPRLLLLPVGRQHGFHNRAVKGRDGPQVFPELDADGGAGLAGGEDVFADSKRPAFPPDAGNEDGYFAVSPFVALHAGGFVDTFGLPGLRVWVWGFALVRGLDWVWGVWLVLIGLGVDRLPGRRRVGILVLWVAVGVWWTWGWSRRCDEALGAVCRDRVGEVVWGVLV